MTRILISLALVLLHAAQAAENRDLILIAGQSNAVGFDATPKELPADPADKEIMFWWRCGDPPPDDFDSVSRGWTTLHPQPRMNPAPKGQKVPRQYGNFSHTEGGFGPEFGFARALHAAQKTPFAVLKAAFSGTGMTTDWDYNDAGPNGACYRALVSETKSAKAKAAEQGIELNLRALIWVQGESDANAKNAPEYGRRLGDMIESLRKELGAPGMIALIGVNTHFGNGKNQFMPVIVEQQKALAARLPRCAYVDTSGLTYANAAHFDSKGTLEMGKRFAEALMQVEKQATADASKPERD